MFYGFAVVWLCLIAYAVSLATREKRLRQQIDGLRKLVEDRGEKR
jgi:CcmD family protein